MAAYAAVVSLFNTIHQIMDHPQLSSSLDNEQIQHLLENTSLLLEFIEANNYGGGSKEAEDLEREITSAAQAAEEMIDSHTFDQIHGETSLSCSIDLQQNIGDMEGVMKRANEFKGKWRYGEEQRTPLLPVMEIEESSMVGLDAELYKLLDELTRDRQSSRQTISIVGMGGMGKTTLCKNIFENKLVKEYFDFRAWATISQQHNAQNILAQLLSLSGKSNHGSVNDLGEQLYKKNLFGRRYLIILDDIWSVQAWHEVRRFFPDNNNGSRIVLTTRLSNVAKDCGSSPFTMKFLDEANSWKLFCEKAFKNESCPPQLREVGEEFSENECCPLELRKVGGEIVKLCKGLALSIVVMGGLLSKSPKTVEYWKDVLEDIKSISGESLDVLSLSYTHLPPHLKPCFLYMGVFKEDSEIRVSEVVKLLVAEGFIKPNGSQVLEEIGEKYLNELIERNLVLVGRRRKNGKIGYCGIHDLVRDLCIKLGEQQQFFRVTPKFCALGTEGILCCSCGHCLQYSHKYMEPEWGLRGPIVSCEYGNTANNTIKKFPFGTERRLICQHLLCEEGQIRQIIRSVMISYLSGHLVKQKWLRVVKIIDDQTDSRAELSHAELSGNVNLRYLAYKNSWEKSLEGLSARGLPSSLTLAWNLQTLIIQNVSKFAFTTVVAPTEIWKMRQLRHVKCYFIYLPPCNGQDEDELLNLHTLKWALNLKLCTEVRKRIPNIKKLYLTYDDRFDDFDDRSLECLYNLDRMCKLESLHLEMRHTEKFSHWNIKELQFPHSLNKLSLADCQLDWGDVGMIGSLPQLEVLILGGSSVSTGERWSPINGQFLRLRFLKIKHCRLKHWDADHSHFPVLQKLHLVYMFNLMEIPPGIGDIPTLELIRVKYCSLSAAISAVKIKEDQLDIGNDTLQIHVTLENQQARHFKERVESEGLSISDIQLKI